MNSVITLLALDKFNVSSVQISTLHNFIFHIIHITQLHITQRHIFFSASKPKGDSNTKTFIENQLPVNPLTINVPLT